MKYFGLILCCLFFALSCKKDDQVIVPVPNKLHMKFTFDENQVRLDSFGQPIDVADGNAAQAPQFNTISAHYVELIPNALTPLGEGVVLYEGPETFDGGDIAIDFDQAPLLSEGELFELADLNTIPEGTYRYIRVSLSYQNFTVDYMAQGFDLTGTLAGFIGYNTYISEYTIDTQALAVNGNKLQGYWGFETVGQVFTGQTPPGATTVVNPIFDTSPVPAGSCLVTGEFPNALVINGQEMDDITLNISLSTNNSFEWVDSNPDGKWEPSANENVVDMGIRGMIPYVNL